MLDKLYDCCNEWKLVVTVQELKLWHLEMEKNNATQKIGHTMVIILIFLVNLITCTWDY